MAYPKEQQYYYMKEFRRKRLMDARDSLGGKCKVCGVVDQLEFDHIDPKTKLGYPSSMLHASKERFWKEVKKCQLLCHKCHRIKSIRNGEIKVAPLHGLTAYRHRKCRCLVCRTANSDSQKKYRKNGE